MPKAATLFCCNRHYENLQTKLWDIDFANPIGIAAGFDKNAEAINALSKFGFGFLEIGTVTPRVQIGNVKPRLFRLCEDAAVINRLGFNNLGAENFAKNLEKAAPQISCAIGVNIGKNKDTEDMLADYLVLLTKFYTKAAYITVNISSPNLKNLRDLQGGEKLDPFLMAIMEKKNELKNLCKKNVPILLKIAPDLTLEEQEKIAEIAMKNKIDGLIISNTTIFRDPNLKSENVAEVGGLSGKPLFEKSNQVLKNIYKFTEGKIPIIGVGGISSAADVYEKIKCGASLVQIYSAFVYEGFGLVERIKKDLSGMIKKDGMEKISQAVGFYLK